MRLSAALATVTLVATLAACSPAAPQPSASPSVAAPAVALDDRPVQEQLVDAVLAGDLVLADLALDAGADPSLYDATTNNGPLRLAITRDDLEMVQLLLANGATVEWLDFGYSELVTAAEFAGADVAQALLDTGANPDGVGEGLGSPIATAAYANNVAVLEVLLAAGADPNIVFSDGTRSYTPLFSAAYGGSGDAALLLINAGADVTARSPEGHAPSDWADSQGYRDVAQMLRDFGA